MTLVEAAEAFAAAQNENDAAGLALSDARDALGAAEKRYRESAHAREEALRALMWAAAPRPPMPVMP